MNHFISYRQFKNGIKEPLNIRSNYELLGAQLNSWPFSLNFDINKTNSYLIF